MFHKEKMDGSIRKRNTEYRFHINWSIAPPISILFLMLSHQILIRSTILKKDFKKW